MSTRRDDATAAIERVRGEESGDIPPPGQVSLVGTGLAVGIVLLALQLWLLTIALDLLLGGLGGQVWVLAVISGLIFLGGLGILWLLDRRPRVMERPAEVPYAAWEE